MLNCSQFKYILMCIWHFDQKYSQGTLSSINIFVLLLFYFFLVLGLYSNIGILAVTCPGFPGYCSESFPGMTCVVVCSRGRPNVPLCQVMIMTFFSWNWYLCLEKKIMMAIDCQITSGSDSFFFLVTIPVLHSYI